MIWINESKPYIGKAEFSLVESVNSSIKDEKKIEVIANKGLIEAVVGFNMKR